MGVVVATGLGKAEETPHAAKGFSESRKRRDEQPSRETVSCFESVQSSSGEGQKLDQDLGSSFTVDWVMRRAVRGETRTHVLEGCLCLMFHAIQEARWHFMWFSQL